jgi:hypothetical protein
MALAPLQLACLMELSSEQSAVLTAFRAEAGAK